MAFAKLLWPHQYCAYNHIRIMKTHAIHAIKEVHLQVSVWDCSSVCDWSGYSHQAQHGQHPQVYFSTVCPFGVCIYRSGVLPQIGFGTWGCHRRLLQFRHIWGFCFSFLPSSLTGGLFKCYSWCYMAIKGVIRSDNTACLP